MATLVTILMFTYGQENCTSRIFCWAGCQEQQGTVHKHLLWGTMCDGKMVRRTVTPPPILISLGHTEYSWSVIECGTGHVIVASRTLFYKTLQLFIMVLLY